MTHPSSQVAPGSEKSQRLISLDAYRGFVMLAMVSGGFGLTQIAEKFPDNLWWERIDYQLSHVSWEGCSFWDLIQPSFMFMVGVAMPYSYASRLAKGLSKKMIWSHVLYRALALVLLGIFLRSNGSTQTRFTFEDVLTQIGLGYAFVYFFIGKGFRLQMAALWGILIIYWLAFVLYPLPGKDFDFAAAGVAPDFGPYSGFFAHWNKNTNCAAAFDVWFLNLFPWPEPWRFNGGGYQTLSFIPSMGTALIGLMAGEWLRGSPDGWAKCRNLLLGGILSLGLGWVAGQACCPIVKRIWTPSWVLFSGGWALLLLGCFYGIVDLKGYKQWTFPLIVVGMNSIAMYVMAHLAEDWLVQTLQTHLGADLFDGFWGPVEKNVSVLVILWLVCLWMYRKKIFLRI